MKKDEIMKDEIMKNHSKRTHLGTHCNIAEDMIAPCGMNCALCVSYQADIYEINKKGFNKKICKGCIPSNRECHYKRKCEKLSSNLVRFCHECKEFPCSMLKTLDSRYRKKYHMSMIENQDFIKKNGIEMFLEDQSQKWNCHECRGLICCHNGLCLNCSLDVLLKNKKYRWGE